MSIAGSLHFNPLTDSLKDSNGKEFMLSPPGKTARRLLNLQLLTHP